MARSGLLWFFTVYLSTLQIQAALVNVDCTKENIGVFGQQSMLECVVTCKIKGKYPKILTVVWKKDGDDDPLLKYDNGKLEHSPRYSLAVPSWNGNNMNVSLLITNTEMADEEDYTCMVITNSGSKTSLTSLKLKAKYNQPTIELSDEKNDPNDEKSLICRTDGGYPRGELRWFSGNDEWTKSSKMEANKMKNGLFSITSRLPLLPGSTFPPQYTCVVYNASGSIEDAATFEVDGVMGASNMKSSNANVVAPMVTIGSLLVGLLLLLVFRRKFFQCKRRMDYTRDEDIEEGELENMKTDADTCIKS
ncbi:LOW QUALITY PROTEIN: butyrophilin subfamily 1 member A1 [Gouania willdenowi]|uniref:LOW QUALITY PROTEIN: butyrophilin subfamily 1 member A1 n=1 Tax=Gouania willdenowi TaxID=441366 RepID=UPI001054FFA6|nr:LOW QUALITY PROTEIN: butyrophilin subfamily 1 member A1-like [Gouania willdenowi]